ncbi:protein NO VEIN domain-containing protein [Aeromicrobium sp.]|uniref:protein NO VEIN domain-containing protein n=1 Tax=Aeromicrobium sp. TaxID=1871063 RepID=UPI002FC64953
MTDDLGRSFVGYREGMTDYEMYEANRGCWRLGPRAQDERYAIFSFDGIVRQAVEISSVEPAPKRTMRSVVYGRVLGRGDRIYDQYVNGPAPESLGRNPISYVPDEAGPADAAFHFGDPESNREVELVAMSFISGQYAVDGWIVEDVSALNCGWDITATKGPRLRHIKVKGLSGPTAKVLFTGNELRAAGHDLNWSLVVVTNALTSPRSREYGPDEIRRLAVPLAYEVDLSRS